MKVYSSENLAMVGNLKNILEGHGIACQIRGEFRGAAMGEIPPIECWPELWVMEKTKVELAKQIVAKVLEPQDDDLRHWRCSECGEEIDGQFTDCWKCGTSRSELR
jgi:Putative prokaryotic signal transducing protein